MHGMKEPIGEMADIAVSMMQEGIATVEKYGSRAEKIPQ